MSTRLLKESWSDKAFTGVLKYAFCASTGFWNCEQIAWKKKSTFWHADVSRWQIIWKEWHKLWHADVSRWRALSLSTLMGIMVHPSLRSFATFLCFCTFANKSLERNDIAFGIPVYPGDLSSADIVLHGYSYYLRSSVKLSVSLGLALRQITCKTKIDTICHVGISRFCLGLNVLTDSQTEKLGSHIAGIYAFRILYLVKNWFTHTLQTYLFTRGHLKDDQSIII